MGCEGQQWTLCHSPRENINTTLIPGVVLPGVVLPGVVLLQPIFRPPPPPKKKAVHSVKGFLIRSYFFFSPKLGLLYTYFVKKKFLCGVNDTADSFAYTNTVLYLSTLCENTLAYAWIRMGNSQRDSPVRFSTSSSSYKLNPGGFN